jgi:predicted GH43/DUF377 family glycosyl hydrolase
MNIKRTTIILKPDYKRVLLRPFTPAHKRQAVRICERIVGLSDEQADHKVQDIFSDFEYRHRDLKTFYLDRFDQMLNVFNPKGNISETKKLLIGACFTMEYSVESAALFNPSLVWHPDQRGVPAGARRFIMSLRATGEGHISSIEFRTGVIDRNLRIHMDQPNRFLSRPSNFRAKNDAEYDLQFDQNTHVSERILFPASAAEQHGIEDARFVQFKKNNGSTLYYATYTAYDGRTIQSKLIETPDFLSFKIRQLKGAAVQNKGMALFPRKVNGQYAMLSRQDNENNYIMFSDNLYHWQSKSLLIEPQFHWEFIQMGNCGSPLETDAGWLVLSHGVGAMRKYSIGAFLLDKENPTKVLGTLQQPLVSPNQEEREGYVPNVVYSCGSVIYENMLIVPYAMSDFACTIALVDLNELLQDLSP